MCAVSKLKKDVSPFIPIDNLDSDRANPIFCVFVQFILLVNSAFID